MHPTHPTLIYVGPRHSAGAGTHWGTKRTWTLPCRTTFYIYILVKKTQTTDKVQVFSLFRMVLFYEQNVSMNTE